MTSIVPSDMALSPTGGLRLECRATRSREKAYPDPWFQQRNPECLFWLQFQRGRIDAVAQPGRGGPVLEDVAEMAVALRAQHFGPDHAVAQIAFLVDMGLRRRLGKARPATAGIEFGI